MQSIVPCRLDRGRCFFYERKPSARLPRSKKERRIDMKDKINGILVQLPLPKHLDDKTVIHHIKPEKDVDAFNPYSVGRIMIGDYDFVPCTPAGIMEMLKYEDIG